MKWKWLSPLIPVAAGLFAAAVLNSGRVANPVLLLRAEVSALVSLLGLLVGLALAGALLLQEWQRRHDRALDRLQAQSLEDRRRFLRRLDHELKNPLTAIRAGLANLAAAGDNGLNENSRRILTSVEAQTLRLSRLTADLRKLSDLESIRLERAAVDLAQLLQEAMELAQDKPQARERRLSLTIPQAPWPLPTVSGDWDLLFLAVYNLLDNTLKFTRAGDTIEVRAFEDGAHIVVEVADTGPGIPESETPYVWEELYRAESARGIPGSGLGLALVRAIVERHGGQVTLRSRAGQGTVVALRLPATPLMRRG
jgi:two-component system, OmpR family, sensor kinase